jgi:hypothetical protein
LLVPIIQVIALIALPWRHAAVQLLTVTPAYLIVFVLFLLQLASDETFLWSRTKVLVIGE